MQPERRSLNETFARLPPEWPADLLPAIRSALQARGETVVVLDDDPTGTQTVHGVPVLMEWSVDTLRAELETKVPAMYLLTNSRSLPLRRAEALNAEIGAALVEAGRLARRRFVVVSRSDSTLRGHFPGEVAALAKALGGTFDAWLLIPFFREGGRFTIDDVHYVAEGADLVPAGETEFARDRAFGYRSSDLREWVWEKTGGQIAADTVASISLTDIRIGGPDRVAERLLELPPGAVGVVNAASTRDLEVFTLGLLATEGRGRRYLYRTAASFVPIRAGLASRPLLTPSALGLSGERGGLIVVGSYVPRTTTQVQQLLALTGVERIELRVSDLLSADASAAIGRAVEQAEDCLRRGVDVVIMTSRDLVQGADAEGSLAIGRRVSEGLAAVVQAITPRPRYVLAKGGITSSDIATRALGMRRALVLGQILPGVPVWQAGPESRYPDLPYLVFPGNVGGPEALSEIVAALRAGANA